MSEKEHAHSEAAFPPSLELLAQARDGDERALDQLFARYYERVRRIVRIRLGHRLRGVLDSGDILQQTFLAATRSVRSGEVKDDSHLIHWLGAIAEKRIHAAAEHMNREKRNPVREVPLATPSGSDLPVPMKGGGPLTLLLQSEDQRRLEHCMAELPEQDREVILLRQYAGASWESVSELTGASGPDAARMQYSRALVKLARHLGRAQFQP